MKTFQPRYKPAVNAYFSGILIVFLHITAAFVTWVQPFAMVINVAWFAALFFDLAYFLKIKKALNAIRIVPNRFSNGDENTVMIQIENRFPMKSQLTIVDELPLQLQERDFAIEKKLEARESIEISYTLRPVERGIYQFGDIHIWAFSPLKMIKRHYRFQQAQQVAVYPSFHRLAELEMLSFADAKNQMGLKRIRHLGYNREFEQVKDYTVGDEIRHINWKATARKNRLMVNQFQDEKSQSVYCVIDMGRTMEMPFRGMSLLDHAINASLALSQIVLKNDDKAGLLTYNTKIQSILPAEKAHNQLNIMMEQLYGLNTAFEESYLEPVYTRIRRSINHRSLLVFFINFESIHSIQRHLPLYIRLAKLHLVLLVNFLNTEIESVAHNEASSLEDIYRKTVASELLNEKRTFLSELGKYGIYTLFEAPENIGIQTINKYLAIKSRGLL